MTGLYLDKLPEEVRENTRAHRTFAGLIRELGEQHERHVAEIEAAEKRIDAFGERIDAAFKAWSEL